MDLIVETDVGHDPDDLFTLCYLLAAGVDIRAVLVTPGDPDQVAIARFICERAGKSEIPIGVSHLDREKNSSGSIHHELLRKYNWPLSASHDGPGVEIMEWVLEDSPDAELLIIGPASTVGQYLLKHPNAKFERATMQGGFLPYSMYRPLMTQPKFEGKDEIATFNLNGDRTGGKAFLEANIEDRRMVGKNICHNVVFYSEHLRMLRNLKHPAARLFEEAARMYFSHHGDKKFHDPTAACLHLYPEIGTWYKGKTIQRRGGWTTGDGDDLILADIDYRLLWEHLLGMN